MNGTEVYPRCPEATALVEAQFHHFAARNPLLETLKDRFLTNAGVRIQNLVDHWVLPETPELLERLPEFGFVQITLPEGDAVWKHPTARLPDIRFKSKRKTPCLALLVDDLDAFATANELALDTCHGDPDSQYQCAHLALPDGELMLITRQGYKGYAPGTLTPAEQKHLKRIRERLANRSRKGEESAVVAETRRIASEIVAEIGQARATDAFFRAERDYWLSRNRAAQWQYAQQQHIGIGWANHDHHTYRCSRASFRTTLELWDVLGFVQRERFYAGADAGWGAQVLEHPISRVVLFTDVDMAPEELNIDFMANDLPPRDDLGTIGLWCALHGSSIAEAGMHHLECEFDFAQTQALLEANGHPVMPPFTDLPMLKQAFTVAEMWKVAPERAQALVTQGTLTPEQAERFIMQGAAGSHLEILQRKEGFKGFNKTGVSAIIRDTDARRG